MSFSRLLFTCAGVLACGTAGMVNGASAGPWQDRPVRLLVPFAPGGGVDTFARTIALAKAKPGALNYGSTGVGSPLHLAAELFKTRAGIDMAHVPYKGGAPAVAAVLGGEIQALIVSLPSALPHVRTGRLTALAVTGPARSMVAPDIPTIAESGFPGFEVTSWYGLLLPAKTPQHMVIALQDAALKVVQIPEVREQLLRQGLDITTRNAAQFAAQIRIETALWAKLVKSTGIRAE